MHTWRSYDPLYTAWHRRLCLPETGINQNFRIAIIIYLERLIDERSRRSFE